MLVKRNIIQRAQQYILPLIQNNTFSFSREQCAFALKVAIKTTNIHFCTKPSQALYLKNFQWSSKGLSHGFLQRNISSTVSHGCRSNMKRCCAYSFLGFKAVFIRQDLQQLSTSIDFNLYFERHRHPTPAHICKPSTTTLFIQYCTSGHSLVVHVKISLFPFSCMYF